MNLLLFPRATLIFLQDFIRSLLLALKPHASDKDFRRRISNGEFWLVLINRHQNKIIETSPIIDNKKVILAGNYERQVSAGCWLSLEVRGHGLPKESKEILHRNWELIPSKKREKLLCEFDRSEENRVGTGLAGASRSCECVTETLSVS